MDVTTENAEGSKHVDNLNEGDLVSVVRSAGRLEDGWRVDRFENNVWKVQSSTPDGEILEKGIRAVELYAINKPNDTDHKFPMEQWKELWQKAGGGEISMPPNTKPPDRLSPKQARGFFSQQPLDPSEQPIPGRAIKINAYKQELRAAAFGRGPTSKEIRQITGT